MTIPCLRCAELERRLSESEREMFEALRARVEELEVAARRVTVGIGLLTPLDTLLAIEDLEKVLEKR